MFPTWEIGSRANALAGSRGKPTKKGLATATTDLVELTKKASAARVDCAREGIRVVYFRFPLAFSTQKVKGTAPTRPNKIPAIPIMVRASR